MSSLQPHHINNLILILRSANLHYKYVASRLRATLRPTHHARKQARRKGLTVDVRKAIACAQSQVSNVPLPVLDISPQTPESLSHDPEIIGHELTALAGCSPLETYSQLELSILNVVSMTHTSPDGTTCALSTPSSPLYSPDSIAHLSPPTSSVGHEAFPTLYEWKPLDVHIDVERISWGLVLDEDVVSDMDLESPPSSTGDDSSFYSSEPITPPVNKDSPYIYMRRAKRKSAEVSQSPTDYCELAEKRLRFDQEGDMIQRRNVVRIASIRR